MDILTTKECAAFLRIHENTVLRYAAKGIIPHVRIGKTFRFSRTALEAYIGGDGRDGEKTSCQMTESLNDRTPSSGGRLGPTPAERRIAARLGLRS